MRGRAPRAKGPGRQDTAPAPVFPPVYRRKYQFSCRFPTQPRRSRTRCHRFALCERRIRDQAKRRHLASSFARRKQKGRASAPSAASTGRGRTREQRWIGMQIAASPVPTPSRLGSSTISMATGNRQRIEIARLVAAPLVESGALSGEETRRSRQSSWCKPHEGRLTPPPAEIRMLRQAPAVMLVGVAASPLRTDHRESGLLAPTSRAGQGAILATVPGYPRSSARSGGAPSVHRRSVVGCGFSNRTSLTPSRRHGSITFAARSAAARANSNFDTAPPPSPPHAAQSRPPSRNDAPGNRGARRDCRVSCMHTALRPKGRREARALL